MNGRPGRSGPGPRRRPGFASRVPRRIATAVPAGAALALAASPAGANAGLPMIVVTLPAMVVALVPLVAVETVVLARSLGAPARSLVRAALVANVVSTLAGTPLTWLLLLVAQLSTGGGRALGIDTPGGRLAAVTWQAPWLVPYGSALHWMIPAAALALLVPFFLASWWIEWLVVRHMRPGDPPGRVRRATLAANAISYAGLAAVAIAALARETGGP